MLPLLDHVESLEISTNLHVACTENRQVSVTGVTHCLQDYKPHKIELIGRIRYEEYAPELIYH